MRYFFNFNDGETIPEDEGFEFADMEAVKKVALQTSCDMVREMKSSTFWGGEPWTLRVTDKSNGLGTTLLTMTFTCKCPG